MLRLFLFPVVGLGALLLLTGRFGAGGLPEQLGGLPTPMVLFIGLGVFILASLRTALND